MSRCISTAGDSSLRAPHAGVPTGVGAVCPPTVVHPEALRDALTSGIAAEVRAAMSAVYVLEAEHWPLAPSAEAACSTFLELVMAILPVLRVAVQIEPDPVEVGFWYRRTRIAELGGLTAMQLVSLGRAEEVIGFLLSICDGGRD